MYVYEKKGIRRLVRSRVLAEVPPLDVDAEHEAHVVSRASAHHLVWQVGQALAPLPPKVVSPVLQISLRGLSHLNVGVLPLPRLAVVVRVARAVPAVPEELPELVLAGGRALGLAVLADQALQSLLAELPLEDLLLDRPRGQEPG